MTVSGVTGGGMYPVGTAPTAIYSNRATFLTTRNVIAGFSYEQGNFRYFVIPPSIAVVAAPCSLSGLRARAKQAG